MSGFAVSAARLGQPDTGLISYGEMLDQGRDICAAVSIPVIGDADTGYGNPMNVKRTVAGYAQAGFAGAMIEDQLAPKRCGHTRGKEVVDREEAFDRIRAAVEARDEGTDILIMARTDARAAHDLERSAGARARLRGARRGHPLRRGSGHGGGDEALCAEAPGRHMANMVEGGVTPILPPRRLAELGYKIAAYPLTLLSAAARAMNDALAAIARGAPAERLLEFAELRKIVGFDAYDAELARFRSRRGPDRGESTWEKPSSRERSAVRRCSASKPTTRASRGRAPCAFGWQRRA